MATWIWLWRRTMRVKGRLTRHKGFRRFVKHETTCKKYKMPTSGRARGDLQMRLSIDTRSTETLRLTAASYSATNRKSCKFLMLGSQVSGDPLLGSELFEEFTVVKPGLRP